MKRISLPLALALFSLLAACGGSRDFAAALAMEGAVERASPTATEVTLGRYGKAAEGVSYETMSAGLGSYGYWARARGATPAQAALQLGFQKELSAIMRSLDGVAPLQPVVLTDKPAHPVTFVSYADKKVGLELTQLGLALTVDVAKTTAEGRAKLAWDRMVRPWAAEISSPLEALGVERVTLCLHFQVSPPFDAARTEGREEALCFFVPTKALIAVGRTGKIEPADLGVAWASVLSEKEPDGLRVLDSAAVLLGRPLLPEKTAEPGDDAKAPAGDAGPAQAEVAPDDGEAAKAPQE
jgi:hypothetical protein